MSKRKLSFANNPLLGGPALGERVRLGGPYRELQLSAIERDSNQPRIEFDSEKLEELASSIRLYGVLSPILVRTAVTPGKFILISGERRFRASQLAGLETIPAIVSQDADVDDKKLLAMQLVENIQRADLTSLERSHAIGALRDAHALSVRDIAERLGISKSMVQRSLEILELPDDLLNALKQGASESKILLLAKIEDPEVRASYLKDLEVLTRSQLEKNISKSDKDSANSDKPELNHLSPEDLRIVDEIQRAIGLKVKLQRANANSEAGRLIIEIYNDSDFQEVFRKLVYNG